VTGCSVARDEGRTSDVLDVLSWNLDRIKALIEQGLTEDGRRGLLFELEELESEIRTIQMVPHEVDEIHDAFENLRHEFGLAKQKLQLQMDVKVGKKRVDPEPDGQERGSDSRANQKRAKVSGLVKAAKGTIKRKA